MICSLYFSPSFIRPFAVARPRRIICFIDATISGDNETPQYGGQAIPVLLEKLLNSGTPNIDAVSGATVTSTAVIEAAKECFMLAGVTF